MRRVRFLNCGHAPAMSANAAVNLNFFCKTLFPIGVWLCTMRAPLIGTS